MQKLDIQNTHRPIDVVLHWRNEGVLEMSPSYQRGEVWGPIRQTNLIRSLAIGVPVPSIIVNDRSQSDYWEEDVSYSVIDGKQRVTAVLRFLDNKFTVPGEWFGSEGSVLFCQLPIADQRRFRHRPIAFSEARLPDFNSEKAIFELINFGGVPQGESDLPV